MCMSRNSSRNWKDRVRLYRSNSAGTAGVEFAFVVPVFMAMTFAAIEFGHVMYSKAEFEYAFFNATRFGMVSRSADTTQIKKSLSDNFIFLDPANLSTLTVSEVVNADKTRTATVTAVYKVDFLAPITEHESVTFTKSVSFLRLP